MYPRSFPTRAGKPTEPRAPDPATLRSTRLAEHDQGFARAAAAPRGVITRALRALVRTYRWWVRPVLPTACRFYPSCSEYAEQALERHGACPEPGRHRYARDRSAEGREHRHHHGPRG